MAGNMFLVLNVTKIIQNIYIYLFWSLEFMKKLKDTIITIRMINYQYHYRLINVKFDEKLMRKLVSKLSSSESIESQDAFIFH